MKDTVLFFLSLVIMCHADLEGTFNNGCPKDTSLSKLLPHEKCEQYYECAHGILIPRFCPSGFQFNAEQEECDWHGDSNCNPNQKRSEQPSVGPTDELDRSNPNHAFQICLSPVSNGRLVAHENCNEFYKCSYGKPVALKCAANLLFNPVNEKCDLPENVDCTERNIAGKSQYTTSKRNQNDAESGDELEINYPDPTQAESVCQGSHNENVLIAHEICNQFYKCSNGQPIAMKCPANLLFNPAKEVCDWPRNVDCNERKKIRDEEYNGNVVNIENDNEESSEEDEIKAPAYSNQATLICGTHDSEGVLIAHEKCNQFYKCSGGIPIHLSCPGTLLFNPSKNYCDWPTNVDCGRRYVNKLETNDNDNERNDNERNDNERNDNERNDNERNDNERNDNERNDNEINDNERNDNETNDNEIEHFPLAPVEGSGETDNNPNQVSTICRGVESEGILVSHELCNHYYKCHDSRAVAMKCPSNLLYNPAKEYCDWPVYVDCGDRTIPDKGIDNDDNTSDNSNDNEYGNGHRSDPKEAESICAEENSDGLLIAHENCNQFYKCFEGKPVALFCQLNLHYNPVKEYCDWPHNVNCGKRMIPGKGNSADESYIANSKSSVCYGNPDGSIVPHENCSQFYKCISDQTYPMDCPPGLHFNSLLKVCDWPVNVDCGDRKTETQSIYQPRKNNVGKVGGVRRI